MKTNILKKCTCLLLISGLFAPIRQIKADFPGPELATNFILEAAIEAHLESSQKLSKAEALNILITFLNAECKLESVEARQFGRALTKLNMPLQILLTYEIPNRTYQIIQENLDKLPWYLQRSFKAISEEAFCEKIKLLRENTNTDERLCF